MIQVNNLSFAYHRKKPALFDGLNLELAPGTICGILGKNGAGKTTLLRLVSGLLFPKAGSTSIMDNEAKERKVSILENLFYVQEEYILPDISMRRYVDLNHGFYPNWDGEKFRRIINDFELPENGKLKELSFGQKKKFLVAFALATGCKILILDEPTNGLDIPSKIVFRKVVSASLNEDQCVLISTHQVKDVANLLDRIIVVEGGRVIFNKDIYEISSAYNFDFHQGTALPDSYLYAEQIPGGHLVITSANGQQSKTEIDIEVLFNAIISKSI